MNKAVVFDLDGTIIDSFPDIAEHVNITLERFGAKKREYNEILSFTGDGAKNLIIRSFGQPELSEQEIQERLDFYNDSYTNSGSPKTKVFDGVGEMLVELKKRGYKIAILTNKPQITTDDIKERLLKEYNFDEIVGFREGAKVKPDPTALLQILAKLDVLPENAYFVGDGEPDAQIAINAGVKGISELWGYRTRQQLESAGAKVFVEKPSELLSIIK